MKVAIPIWDGRISPVMDIAERLLTVDIDEGKEVSRTIVDIPRSNASQRAGIISKLGVNVLICGAISHQLNRMISSLGIEANPWIRGEVEAVLVAYLKGVLQSENFLLPGCKRRRCRGRCRGDGRGNGRGLRQSLKEES